LDIERELRISVELKPASIEELVAVPNVTAIDCKQVDVYGPKLRAIRRHELHGSKRLVPPFL
jgi:hypothetical protein